MIVKSTQFRLWLQCILFDNKLSIYLSIYLSKQELTEDKIEDTFPEADDKMPSLHRTFQSD